MARLGSLNHVSGDIINGKPPCPFMNSRPVFLLTPCAKVSSERSTPKKTDAIAACAEGYAFPTNLDRDPPIGGLAPQTQQQLMKKALAENWEPKTFNEALDKHSGHRLT